MTNQDGIPQKRDVSRKHKLILDHAIEVFTRKGFTASSMDEIAECAGVSKRTVYNHFKSKENLFQEIVSDFIAERDGRKKIEYSSSVSLEKQLRLFIKAEMFLIDDPVRRGLSRLLTSVFLIDTESQKATVGRYSPYQDFINWLQAAEADGRLVFDSAVIAARIFYGLVEGCITWGAMMSDGASLIPDDPVIAEIIGVFLCRYGK